MLPLYGGRSSELAGLPLSDVHEDEPIPYLQIDYTEDRGLKNTQSVRKLPIHPELIRLGFLDYIREIRAAGCTMLFPEMASPKSTSFASTFYKSIFNPWRKWAFPNGTPWLHQDGGAWKDKDVHSFRGLSTTMLKGRVEDSVRCDIFGHEGETETARTYDEEARSVDQAGGAQTPYAADRAYPGNPANPDPSREPAEVRGTDAQSFGTAKDHQAKVTQDFQRAFAVIEIVARTDHLLRCRV
ncbi:hypothetical protein P0F65_05875 [Sphingomonas sp. I4]